MAVKILNQASSFHIYYVCSALVLWLENISLNKIRFCGIVATLELKCFCSKNLIEKVGIE